MPATLAKIVTQYIGDDWVFPFQFQAASGAGTDMSAITFSASLITESPYASTAIAGANGSVDQSQAASGIVSVTVADALTSTLTQDMDSVDVPTNGSTSFNTRLALVGVSGSLTTTYAIIPIRVVRR